MTLKFKFIACASLAIIFTVISNFLYFHESYFVEHQMERLANTKVVHQVIRDINILNEALDFTPTESMDIHTPVIHPETETYPAQTLSLLKGLQDILHESSRQLNHAQFYDLKSSIQPKLDEYSRQLSTLLSTGGESHSQPKLISKVKQSHAELKIILTQAQQELEARINNESNQLSLLKSYLGQISLTESLLDVLIILFMAYVGLQLLLRPLRQTTHTLTQLANDQLDVTIEGQKRKDEMGKIAQALEVLKKKSAKIKELNKINHQQALTKQQDIQTQMKRLALSLDDAVANVISTIQHETRITLSHTKQLTKESEEVLTQSNEIVHDIKLTTEGFEGVTTKLTSFTQAIQDINTQIRHSQTVNKKATRVAAQTHRDIESLDEAMQQIEAITRIIQNVAEQTKLLALNANIEAARAGEAGKGFAVVANEVKSLAKETQEATETIAQQVEGIQKSVITSVKNIHKITKTISDVDTSTETIAKAIKEQEAATQAISQITSEVAKQNESSSQKAFEMFDASKQNSRLSKEVTILIEDVNNQVQDLNERMKVLLQESTKDHRKYPRFTIQGLTCDLQLNGIFHTLHVIDVSQKGASLSISNDETFPIGTPGILTLRGFAHPINVKTAGLYQSRLRLIFNIDVEIEIQLLSFINSIQNSDVA